MVSHSSAIHRHARSTGKKWWPLALGVIAILATVAAAAPYRPADASVVTTSIYSGANAPATSATRSAHSAEVGVYFTVSAPGSVSAIRFYKTAGNTGKHTGSLWTSTGQRLATVNFSSESSTGWQQATLRHRVKLTPGVTYIASYHTSTGHYAQQLAAFTNGATLGNATIRATAGAYHAGSSAFPGRSQASSAYYVDVAFQLSGHGASATGNRNGNGATVSPPSSATASTGSGNGITTSPAPGTTAVSTTPVATPTPVAPAPPKSSVSSPAPGGGAAGAPVPAACAGGGSYLWAHLESCGWPGAGNTGPVMSNCPGGLKASGAIRASTPNQVISCLNISGCLEIAAPNVTVQDVQIACSSGKTGEAANGTSVINVADGASGTIKRVSIDGLDGVHACIWHQGTALTVDAVNCSHVNDGIFSWADTGYSSTTGDHFTISNSYFHDFTVKTANGHIDGYQTEGAGNGLINHNTYYMTSDDGNSTDSAIAIWDSIKSSHDITVSNNLIAGGGFSMYAEDYNPSEGSPGGGFSVTNIVFTNNRFSTALFGCVGYYGIWYTRGAPSDGWHRSGNTVLETGANVDAKNPSSGGQLCS
jgi:hypothetical protein